MNKPPSLDCQTEAGLPSCRTELAMPWMTMTSFELGSILGFVDSPEVEVRGSDQFRSRITIKQDAGSHQRPRLLTSPLKDVPRFLFARVKRAGLLTLHLYFPHLPHHYDFARLTDEQFSSPSLFCRSPPSSAGKSPACPGQLSCFPG